MYIIITTRTYSIYAISRE